jgi:hypothetical protein
LNHDLLKTIYMGDEIRFKRMIELASDLTAWSL